jgi:hypothetical protein
MVDDLLSRLDPRPVVVWDEQSDEWDTARRAVLAYDPAASHHVVVQDDAVPCRDLLAAVASAVAFVPPGAVVGLYSGGVSPRVGNLVRVYREADETGASWIAATRLHWGVATVFPTSIIEALVAGCDRISVREYDRRVGSWLRRKAVPVWYSVPSMVDHRPGPSLLSHDRPYHRRAHRFVGEDVSALSLPWDGPVVGVRDPRAPVQQVRAVSRHPAIPHG